MSEFDRRIAIEQGVATEDRLVTIHNGMLDLPASLRADPGAEPVHLVMVARFESQKDHGTLFRALAQLRELPWSLDLIGDGPLLQRSFRECRELGLAERVRYCGASDDVPAFLKRAQVFVLTSNWEGFPRSIIEAMRAGLPVVASRVGGVEEAVEDGASGFLAPRGDAPAVARALRRLLENPELRRRQGARGRHRYEAEFTLAKMVARTLEVYRAVVEAARKPSTPAV